MSKINKSLIFFTLMILFQSCNTNESKYQYVKTHTIKQIGEKVIELDSLTSPTQITFYFYDMISQKKLYVLSELDNSLQIYDWAKGKLESKKILPMEGPNGVGKAGSVMVKSLDSIFIVSGFQFKLYQLDKNYNVVKYYSLLESTQKKQSLGQGMFAASNNSCEIGYWKNKIYLSGYPFIDRGNEKFYSEGITSLSVNLENSEVNFLTKVPPSYNERFSKGYKIAAQQITPSSTFNYEKQQMIINHMTDFNLEVFDMNKNKGEFYYVGSDEVKDFTWASKSIGKKDMFKYFLKQPGFPAIYYDSYRKVYYRIFEKPNPEKVDGYDNRPWTIPSIIIINEDFKKIGEVELPKAYSLTSIIIAKEGLYLKKFVGGEDKIVFTLFKLTKL